MALLLLVAGSMFLLLAARVPDEEERRLRALLGGVGRRRGHRVVEGTVRGTAIDGGSALRGPVSGEPAVWFHLVGAEEIGGAPERARERGFCEFVEEIGQGEFEIDGECGRVRVHLGALRPALLPGARRFHSGPLARLPSGLRAFLADRGHTPSDPPSDGDARLRCFIEERLAPGDRVTVILRDAELAPAAASAIAPYRGSAAPAPPARVLFLSTESHAALLARVAPASLWRAITGLALVAGGISVLLANL